MKGLKKADVLIAGVIVILIGMEICMEARFPCEELVLKSEDTGDILREIPEMEIAERDRLFFEELSRCAGVADLLDGGEDGFVFAAEDAEVRAAAEEYLGAEEADFLTVNVAFQENGDITKFLNWGETGKSVVCMQETGSGDEKEYYKICSFGSFPGRRVTYENWNNESARKSMTQRRWFAWLRDRMWEDA